ncbi:plasma-membrane choline transporter (macronuclear) [Tetrahymena thermophila SB210]|uniref:Choline transporter-like protein n=1 Tax=Tetrahymena thermophila (strain SB210) TaxID=312017 RepID=I7MDF9_TETTS|nr:plasma-membrane choline transporter [Tetrahymena thermophila SB210]EAR87511.1 plasma-membrane choline transporter [Tetrahymena thermophila SB210]|eukprot:XP_001007756.1 plasma-membrane choline transporter [Tetrahymena thermophila SB210]
MAQDKTEEKKQYNVDENLANGPLASRGCNDIFCCLLFLANIAAIIAIGAYGLSKGHPDRLLVGYDSYGRACGFDSLSDYKYVYLTAPGSIKKSICLDTCPTDPISDESAPLTPNQNNSQAQASWQKVKFVTTPGALQTDKTYYTLNIETYMANTNSISFDDYHVAVYQTRGYFNRVCLPYGASYDKVMGQIGDAFGASGTTNLERYISDIKTAWGMILGSVGIAFVIAFVYMVILRYCSGLITWLTIIAYFAIITAFAIILLVKGQNKYDEGVTASDKDMQQDGKNLKYLSYAVFALDGLFLITFLCLFNRIRLAIAIIKSAALFVGEVKTSFLVPPVVTIFCMLFTAWWIVAFVFVYSVGDIQGSEYGPFASVKWQKNTRYMLIYHIFGGLWINAFFGALIQFILATACSLWYFSKPNEPHQPVYTGVKRGLTNHFGSLAFGALILAIVQFIRLVLEFMEQQVKKSGQGNNTCVKYLLKCLQCYVACFERFIKFLNKNAYIQIALTGKGFCSAAKDAFELIWCNPAKFGTVATIGNIFIFIGRLFIAGITGLISYIILIKSSYYDSHLFSPIVPTVFCVVIGYFVGTFFMSVYGMGIDTILQCTCLDEELTKKTGKDSQRCPGPLKEFFDQQGKK